MNFPHKHILSILCVLFCIGNLHAQQQKTNLPTVYITTEGGAPVTSKDTWVKGNIIVKSSDSSEELNMVTEIRGRGNSTWGMPKKPYRIKLDKKTNFLNLPAKEKNWVFLANYADKTLVRNAVAFKISKIVGLEFTPSVRFVDLELNGVFVGNYMVTDQIEVATNRVPVETQSTTETQLPGISGGYLLEIDGFADAEPVKFITDKGLKITIKYPKDDEINTAQREYITNFTQKFENALFSSDFKNKDTGYRSLVDTTSLINWYIACELTGNSDSFWSTYVYKYKDVDSLFFGPLWDYDIAFNNDDRLGDATQKLMRNDAHEPKTWIKRMWEDEWFRGAVNRRWKQLVDAGIQNQLLSYVDETAGLLSQSQQMNFERWPVLNTKVYRELSLFPSYQQGVDFLKNYLKNRVAFLTTNFASTQPEEPSAPFVAENYYYMIMNKRTNNLIEVQDQSLQPDAKLQLSGARSDDPSQHWVIQSLGGGKFQLINRNSGLAIAGNGRSQNLIQVNPDASDPAQQWKITPVNTGNVYGLENVKSNYSANNSGGSFENGTPVIEYDNRIAESENQQWYIQKVETIITGIEPVTPYSAGLLVFPNPAKETVFVGLPLNKTIGFTLQLYSVEGKCIYRFSGQHTGFENDKIWIPLTENGIRPGLYFIKVRTKDGKEFSSKLIVK